MAYADREFVYEVLVRFNAAGFQGAHQVSLKEVYDTESNTVLSSILLPPAEIGTAGVAEVLGADTALMLNAMNDLQVANDALHDQVDELEKALAAAEAEIASLRDQSTINAMRSSAASGAIADGSTAARI